MIEPAQFVFDFISMYCDGGTIVPNMSWFAVLNLKIAVKNKIAKLRLITVTIFVHLVTILQSCECMRFYGTIRDHI